VLASVAGQLSEGAAIELFQQLKEGCIELSERKVLAVAQRCQDLAFGDQGPLLLWLYIGAFS